MKYALCMENNMKNEMTNETNIKILVHQLNNVELEGINLKDAPDFVDAFVSYAELKGRPLTDEELDEVNACSDYVHALVEESIY